MGWACASDCGTLDTVTILSLNQARSYVKFLHVFLEDRVRDSSNQGRETAAPNPLQHVETKSGCTVHSQQMRTQETRNRPHTDANTHVYAYTYTYRVCGIKTVSFKKHFPLTQKIRSTPQNIGIFMLYNLAGSTYFLREWKMFFF